ncbi:MAG: ATP synthase subunit b [Holosporales bacterium]
MHNNPYIFLSISFFVFLYIIYKKMMPMVNENLMSYRQQIAGKLLELDEAYTHLENRLNDVNDELSGVQETVDGIFKDMDDKIKRLSETSSKKTLELMTDMEKNAQHNMQKMKTKAEKKFLVSIADDLNQKLLQWAKENSKTHVFQKASINQSFFLLKDVLKK